MQAQRQKTAGQTITVRSRPANDNMPKRRVVVQLSQRAPVTLVETEVFDALIGSFVAFAANDNDNPLPNPSAIRGPPTTIAEKMEAYKRKEVA